MTGSPVYRKGGGIGGHLALDIYICKNIIGTNRQRQRQAPFGSVTDPAFAPTAGELNAALKRLLARTGLPPGGDLRVSSMPAGFGLMYQVEVLAAAEPALSKALPAILGYQIPVHNGSFRLYAIEAQLLVGAAKHSDVA
jgi:hypothetical protein